MSGGENRANSASRRQKELAGFGGVGPHGDAAHFRRNEHTSNHPPQGLGSPWQPERRALKQCSLVASVWGILPVRRRLQVPVSGPQHVKTTYRPCGARGGERPHTPYLAILITVAVKGLEGKGAVSGGEEDQRRTLITWALSPRNLSRCPHSSA